MPSKTTNTNKKLRILFVMRSVFNFNNYSSIIAELCANGHHVHLICDEGWSEAYPLEPIERFKNENSNFSFGWSIRRGGLWRSVIFVARELRTYRRFLRVKSQSTHFRDRWINYLPLYLRWPLKHIPITNKIVEMNFVGNLLGHFEEKTRADKRITRDIQTYNPDIVVVAPGNMRFSEEIEYLKAAKYLKIPTVIPVFSWDNLTTKGLFHVEPDRLLVWSNDQVNEAKEHHEFSEENIRVVGASVFDKWFTELKPSCSRVEFLTRHGLRVEDPFVVYLGTTRNFAVDETWIIKKLRRTLDGSSDKRLRDTQIIVRPHPANHRVYESIGESNLHVIPKGGALPNTKESLQLFYDTLYYATAVIVGVHTSAMIESAIVGKPLIVIVTEKYKSKQMEVQHFQQFLSVGALELVYSDKDIRQTIIPLLEGRDKHVRGREQFIDRFIRPRGRDIPAGRYAAEEIEKIVVD